MSADRLAGYRRELQTYIAEAVPGYADAVVSDLVEISAGWESDVYAFDLAGRERQVPLVLRVYPGKDASTTAVKEFNALRRLHGVGYPVPAVISLEQTATRLGKPFIIMERVEGHGMWRETFSGRRSRQRSRFELFCRLFADLHALDWRTLTDDDPPGASTPHGFVDRYLEMFGFYCDRFQQPGFLPILEWLKARRDRMGCVRPAPIHWDFHPENILIRRDGSAVVIDWTQFEISDPRFDLAWTMILVGSAEGGDIRERILRSYRQMSAYPVEEIELFEVAACAKRLASVTISFAAGAEELGMRAGAEELMRRNFPALARVYGRLQDLTGQRVPEVEALFDAG